MQNTSIHICREDNNSTHDTKPNLRKTSSAALYAHGVISQSFTLSSHFRARTKLDQKGREWWGRILSPMRWPTALSRSAIPEPVSVTVMKLLWATSNPSAMPITPLFVSIVLFNLLTAFMTVQKVGFVRVLRRFTMELNERYSDVTLRMLVIRCAKGDVPTADIPSGKEPVTTRCLTTLIQSVILF